MNQIHKNIYQMHSKFISTGTFLIIITLSLNIAYAQTSKKTFVATKTDHVIVIDGILDETAWKSDKYATDFIQIEPYNGKQANQNTKVWLYYDDYSLYIGAYMYDATPDSIVKHLSVRDDDNNTDMFGIVLDPYNDGLSGVNLAITAAGVQIDLAVNGDNEDGTWNAVWQSDVAIQPDGWSAEIRIPYSAIRFPKDSDKPWGANFYRIVGRSRETSAWSYVDREIDGYIQQSGILEGIHSIKPPIRLSITPYTAFYVVHDSKNNQWARSLKGGLDLKYGINESFTLDVMLVPDFGQVQADDQILNLTPYEIYYSERRLFFMENSQLFARGNWFYSRRIGASPKDAYEVYNDLDSNEMVIINQSETQLLNAFKISGKTTNGLSVGFLNAMSLPAEARIRDTITGRERAYITQEFTNYNVMVLEKALINNSYVSFLNTNVYIPKDDYIANFSGFESLFNNKSKSYAIYSQMALNSKFNNGNNFTNGHQYRLEFMKTSGKFKFELMHLAESDTYDPNDLGYLQNNNERTSSAEVSYDIYTPFGSFLSFRNSMEYTYSMLYKPNVFTADMLEYSSIATFKNHLTLGLELNAQVHEKHNYDEPRAENRYFAEPAWGSFGGFISSDYSKPFALDVSSGYYQTTDENSNGIWLNVSPRFRIGKRVTMIYRTNYSTDNENFGWIGTDSETSAIYFGKRNLKTFTNTFTVNYIFTNKAAFNARLRYYHTTAEYIDYHELTTEGNLINSSFIPEDPDQNFNTMNIDVSYVWELLPGSQLSLVWKNAIVNQNSEVGYALAHNLENTLDSDQINSLSVRLLLYLDYLMISRKAQNLKKS